MEKGDVQTLPIDGFVANEIPSQKDDLPKEPSRLLLADHNSTPWDFLSHVLGFVDEDQKLWWYRTAPSLGRLMQKAQYSIHTQYSYLSWFYVFILPALGRHPELNTAPKWIPHLAHNHSPFEPSLNVRGTEMVVRFTIEPMSCYAGDVQDPFNQQMSLDLMDRLQKAIPDLNISWFDHFAREFFMSAEATHNAKIRTPLGQTLPTCFIAFDLIDSKVSVKPYFFPIRKSIATGTSPGELVYQAVKAIETDGISLSPALDAFYKYLEKGGNMCPADVEMLAIDCIKPSQARVKIYAHSFHNSFNKIRDIYTLGGSLDGETTKTALEALKELWILLFELPDEGTELPHIEHPRSCIVYGFEIKPGSALPETKIYFPLWHYAGSDAKAAAALSKFFQQQGWGRLATSYSDDLAAVFPNHDLGNSAGTHSYLSFAYTKKAGPYMTMYYSPKTINEL